MLVAALWGATNPFLKRGTTGISKLKADSFLGQLYVEFTFLLSNWQYVVPFLINQIGSLVYYVVLSQGAALSLAVPVTNSLTFVFTAIVGSYLGEDPLDLRSILGIACILAGTTICYMSAEPS